MGPAAISPARGPRVVRVADRSPLQIAGYSRNAIVHQGRVDPGVDLIQTPVAAERLGAIVRKLLDA